ncbi:MAG: site-2 protease family protein [Gemmatales bacterium]|nr:site-2 protease family protein [Gemmatales bacterium]MDW8385883.1 site-2 protease family protein [Gemmatales bacterium]
MFGARWTLFRLLGIPINIDASWLVILALLTWTLSSLFSEVVEGLPPWTYWLMGVVSALAFFGCILLHELGHSVVAKAMGIPIRGITLFMFGGVAELEEEPRSAMGEFLMAIAGPAVSAVLFLWFLFTSLLPLPSEMRFPLMYLAWINLAVLIFNMIPAFPLDGGRVLRSILWGVMDNLRRATYVASLLGRGFAWLFIGIGVFELFAGYWLQGIWLGLIGLFLNNAALASYQSVYVRQILGGEPVARFMTREPIVVPPDIDLRRLVEDYMYRYHRKMFPVAANGRLQGVISTQELARIPREEWDIRTVGEVMRQDLENCSIPPTADALQALSRMQHHGCSRLLVVDSQGNLVGVVSLKDLLRFLDLKLELENAGNGFGG